MDWRLRHQRPSTPWLRPRACGARQLGLQNEFTVGSGFWLWKQKPGFYGWSVVQPDGALRKSTKRAQILSLPHVDSVPGRLLGTSMNMLPTGGLLATSASTADGAHDPILSATISSAGGGTATFWRGSVVVSGGPSLLSDPLTQAFINSKPVPSKCEPVRFLERSGSGSTALYGCIVTVKVPAGTFTVTLKEADTHSRR